MRKKVLGYLLLVICVAGMATAAGVYDEEGHKIPGVVVYGVQRTPAISTVSASGTVTAGVRRVTFVFSSDFAGTVLTATFAGATDSSITIEAPAGDTLAAIAYTRSAGSMRILEVR